MPDPYSQLQPVAKATLRAYDSIDVSCCLPPPNNPEGEEEEHEFCLFYKIQPAEPDVGIMSAYPDDYFYAMPDGTPVSEHVWEHWVGWADEKDCPEAISRWHEGNLERACEAAEEPDYPDWGE